MLKKIAVAVPAVLALGTVTPAFATSSYDISVGGDTSTADHPFDAAADHADMAPDTIIGRPVWWFCDSPTAVGEVHAGGGHTGIDSISLTNTAWPDCVWYLDFNLEVEHHGEWRFHVTDGAVTGPPAADPEVSGYLSGVELHVYTTNDPTGCAFTVSGDATSYIDEVDQRLVVNEDGEDPDGHDLTVEVSNGGASSCGGLVTDGGRFSLDVSFDLDTHGAGAIDIARAS